MDFANLVKDFVEQFCDTERQLNNQPIAATTHQLNLAVLYIQYHAELVESRYKAWIKEISGECQINGQKEISLFEVIVSIFLAMACNKAVINLHYDSARKSVFEKFINRLFPKVSIETFNAIPTQAVYGTQIIFDSSDVKSAFAELGNAWQDNTAPWRIRSCWIQESLKEKFFAEIQSAISTPDCYFERFQEDIISSVDKTRALGATVIQMPNKRSPAIVCGLTRKQYECEHLVFVNFFRTAKEVVSLVNAENIECMSLWTENISVAYEIADKLTSPNIWINSNGILNPRMPFTSRGRLYGTDLSPIQFAINLTESPSIDDYIKYKQWYVSGFNF